jgi:hypothetical protein
MKCLWRSGLAASALLLLAATQAPAQVTFLVGNHPQANEENVLLNTGLTGTTIVGTTNQSATSVDFTSTETLTAPSNGQARVEAVDGVVGPDTLTISLTNGDIFGDIIFNPFIGGSNKPDPNTLNVLVNTDAGSSSFSYSIGNGSNFLTILADVGVGITSVSLTPTVGFTDLRQIRISGIGTGGQPPAEVPEPGTWAMLAGFGVPAIGLVRRMRKR